MIRLMPLVIALALCGCASTTIYHNGKPAFKTQADAKNLTYSSGGTYFHADELNHSVPTTAGGISSAKIIQSAGTASGALGAAIATSGIIRK